jgi:hypothetical protein
MRRPNPVGFHRQQRHEDSTWSAVFQTAPERASTFQKLTRAYGWTPGGSWSAGAPPAPERVHTATN